MVFDRKNYYLLYHVEMLEEVFLSETMVDFRINWTLSNSVNASNGHSHCHKLKVYATKMSTYL